MIKFFEQHSKISWLITIIGAILIFWISTLNFGNASIHDPKGWISVIYHFSAFFCFGFFLFISITGGKKDKILFFTTFLLTTAYAVTDEIHQHFVPWRCCDLLDLYVDILGILLAMIIYLVVLFWRKD